MWGSRCLDWRSLGSHDAIKCTLSNRRPTSSVARQAQTFASMSRMARVGSETERKVLKSFWSKRWPHTAPGAGSGTRSDSNDVSYQQVASHRFQTTTAADLAMFPGVVVEPRHPPMFPDITAWLQFFRPPGGNIPIVSWCPCNVCRRLNPTAGRRAKTENKREKKVALCTVNICSR